jgi:type VI secretion system secreted protein VgrG
MSLSAGQRVTIHDVPSSHGDEALLVVEVRHEAEIAVFDEAAHEARYTNAFRAVPQGFTYRPPRRTPRPVIAGVVTGVVQLGPDGEKGGVAVIDAEGRYWVELHFDPAQPGAQKTSHPIRMAQPFAGPSYGMHFPLRRGTEVLVAFTNGDPDRPVIVGALYNATSPSPVATSSANKHRLQTAAGVLFEMGSKS